MLSARVNCDWIYAVNLCCENDKSSFPVFGDCFSTTIFYNMSCNVLAFYGNEWGGAFGVWKLFIVLNFQFLSTFK